MSYRMCLVKCLDGDQNGSPLERDDHEVQATARQAFLYAI